MQLHNLVVIFPDIKKKSWMNYKLIMQQFDQITILPDYVRVT